MTFVLGMSCSDGVALVADRRLTSLVGDISHGDKLFHDIGEVIYGFAGSEMNFGAFREALGPEVDKRRNKDYYISLPDLRKAIAASRKQVIGEVGKQAVVDSEMAIVIRASNGITMYYSDWATTKLVPRHFVLGRSESYASLFLKRAWEAQPTMAQVVATGVFCVKWFERFQIHPAVGLASHGTYRFPQVWLMPSDRTKPVQEVTDSKLVELDAWAERRLDSFQAPLDALLSPPT